MADWRNPRPNLRTDSSLSSRMEYDPASRKADLKVPSRPGWVSQALAEPGPAQVPEWVARELPPPVAPRKFSSAADPVALFSKLSLDARPPRPPLKIGGKLAPPELQSEGSFDPLPIQQTEVVYQKCFDFVAYEEINNFMSHLRLNQGVGLIVGKKVYCVGVYQFEKAFTELSRDRNVLVECDETGVLSRDKYVQVLLETSFLFPLVDVVELLRLYREKVTRLFEVKPTGKKLQRTASLGVATRLSPELAQQTSYRKVDSSVGDHCQPGSEKMLYRLVPTKNRQ